MGCRKKFVLTKKIKCQIYHLCRTFLSTLTYKFPVSVVGNTFFGIGDGGNVAVIKEGVIYFEMSSNSWARTKIATLSNAGVRPACNIRHSIKTCRQAWKTIKKSVKFYLLCLSRYLTVPMFLPSCSLGKLTRVSSTIPKKSSLVSLFSSKTCRTNLCSAGFT